MLRNEPLQSGPPFKLYHLARGVLGQSLEACLRRQSDLNAATPEQETDLQGTSVPSSDGYFDGDGYDSSLQASVKSAQKVDGIVVWIDQGDPVAGFQAGVAVFAELFR